MIFLRSARFFRRFLKYGGTCGDGCESILSQQCMKKLHSLNRHNVNFKSYKSAVDLDVQTTLCHLHVETLKKMNNILGKASDVCRQRI